MLGRQVSTLFQTQAGVAPTSGTTSVNGLRSSFSNVTLDGINIQDNFIRTNDLDYAPMRTTIDQVAEITVSTSNARHGHRRRRVADDAVHQVRLQHVPRIGLLVQPQQRAGSQRLVQQQVRRVAQPRLNLNQPGAALGGHIIKDKLFFYANYELYRNKQQSARPAHRF